MIPRRLDKYLADATSLSRSEIEDAWKAGRIAVEPATTPWWDELKLWNPVFEDDVVLFDGEPVAPVEPSHYIALNKPADILSTTDSPHGRPCLNRWLDDFPDAVFPVGRLDRETTGFLLFTDDGDLCFCLLRPWFHVEKEYRLTVAGPVSPEDDRLDELERGIDIGDGNDPARALRTEVIDSGVDESELSVVVDEGRHRMVRRMARGAGFDLHHLHRPRIGPVQMGPLDAGEYRSLTDDEVDALWEACGGKEASKKRQIDALKRQADKWRAQDRPHRRLERWLEIHASRSHEST